MSIFSPDEIEVYQVNPTERERKGYALHSEESLTCVNCKKQLVSLIVVKLDCEVFPGADIVRFICNCPSCNSKSFVKKMERVKVYFKAIEPFSISDTIISGDGREQRCEIILQ
jgi:hypothetical protein